MSNLPFVLRSARLVDAGEEIPCKDTPAIDDFLPTILGNDSSGYILARQTYITKATGETTDDN